MKRIKIKIINDLKEAKNIWNNLSPNKYLCDDWNFRYCFYKYFNYPLFFYAGFDADKIVGLLPLQFNENGKYLEFFGGSYMRDNRIFIKLGYENYINQFYESVKTPAKLISIIGDDSLTRSFDIYKYKYSADISEIKNTNDYFAKNLKGKSRYEFRKKIKLIEKMNPIVKMNNFDDIDLMIELNKKTFGENSSFNKPFRIEAFHDLIKSDFDKYLFTYIINGKKEAVSFSIKYNHAYIYINAGTNKREIPNLGTFNIYCNFEKAIELGSKLFDAGMEDLGWKERWHLKKVSRYAFVA